MRQSPSTAPVGGTFGVAFSKPNITNVGGSYHPDDFEEFKESPLYEFYKKGCQEKSSPSTGGEKIFVSRSSPLSVSAPDCRSRGFALACLPFLWVSSSGGDDANRVLKLGKRTWSWSVNHGSIGGSWPIAISGYPRRHNV